VRLVAESTDFAEDLPLLFRARTGFKDDDHTLLRFVRRKRNGRSLERPFAVKNVSLQSRSREEQNELATAVL
jgi:hypothetical protein